MIGEGTKFYNTLTAQGQNAMSHLQSLAIVFRVRSSLREGLELTARDYLEAQPNTRACNQCYTAIGLLFGAVEMVQSR